MTLIALQAIDEIGWANYHWKVRHNCLQVQLGESQTDPLFQLFFLNGFGYAVDSLLLLLQSVIATPAGYEFTPAYPRALTNAVYVGMLLGALFCD